MNPTRVGAGLSPCQGVGELSYLAFPWKCCKNVECSGGMPGYFSVPEICSDPPR